MNEVKRFKAFGYDWTVGMEGGRLIHPDTPWARYSMDYVKVSEDGNEVELSIGPNNEGPVTYWDHKIYRPIYGIGLMRSVQELGYGLYQADIKSPKGSYLWPSFWLCGVGSWPDHGEIDIMEGYSELSDYYEPFCNRFPWLVSSWLATNNVHYAKSGKHKQVGAGHICKCKMHDSPSSTSYNYKCLWEPDCITILINDKQVRKVKSCTKYFCTPDSKMNVIFNLMTEDPKTHPISLESNMIIKDFKYSPLSK